MNEMKKAYVVRWQNSSVGKDPFSLEWIDKAEIFQDKIQAIKLVKELLLKFNSSSIRNISLEVASLKFEEFIDVLSVTGIDKMTKGEK